MLIVMLIDGIPIKLSAVLTCQSKNMGEDVINNLFTTFNSLDSLSDTLSANFPSSSGYFPILGCFKWMQVLYQMRINAISYEFVKIFLLYFISWETYLCINSLHYHDVKSSHVVTIYRFKVVWSKTNLEIQAYNYKIVYKSIINAFLCTHRLETYCWRLLL